MTEDKQAAARPINFRTKAWQEIFDLSQEIATERGIEKQDLTKTVMEAIHFFKTHRNNLTILNSIAVAKGMKNVESN